MEGEVERVGRGGTLTRDDVITPFMTSMNSADRTSECTSEEQFFMTESSTCSVWWTTIPSFSRRRLRMSFTAVLTLWRETV